MYENTIEEILEKDSFTSPKFIGALARDELPKNINYPSCFVFTKILWFRKIVFNKIRLQGLSNYCGLYCILFLLFKSRNKIKEFYSNFYLKDFYLNDNLIFNLLKKY